MNNNFCHFVLSLSFKNTIALISYAPLKPHSHSSSLCDILSCLNTVRSTSAILLKAESLSHEIITFGNIYNDIILISL